eukprot:9486642-Pyramimonas_sp.AAC.1
MVAARHPCVYQTVPIRSGALITGHVYHQPWRCARGAHIHCKTVHILHHRRSPMGPVLVERPRAVGTHDNLRWTTENHNRTSIDPGGKGGPEDEIPEFQFASGCLNRLRAPGTHLPEVEQCAASSVSLALATNVKYTFPTLNTPPRHTHTHSRTHWIHPWSWINAYNVEESAQQNGQGCTFDDTFGNPCVFAASI